MFIPSDFLQPDRDQWKSVMTLAALVLALANVVLMRIIWVKAFGFSERTYRNLSRAHRTFGYTAFGIMLFIAIVTCIGIIGYGGYADRPTWHSYLGITVLSMMGIKIIAVRKGLPEGAAFRKWAIGVSAVATAVLAVIAATALEAESAFVLPLFPLTALLGFIVWKRFGALPVVGTGMALSIGLLFVSSAGWWFVHKATQDAGPEVSSVLELKGDLETGRAVYQRAGCAGCHGAQGNGGVGPSLRDSRFVYQNTPVTIARQVRSGGGTMPAFGTDRISDQELASLIVFIRNWYSQ